MSALGAALAFATALVRVVLAWLAERPVRIAERQAERIARQRDEASRLAAPAGDLLERMRDGRL